MQLPPTSIRIFASLIRRRQLCAVLVALTLIAVNYNASTISAGAAPTESTIVLDPTIAPQLQGTFQVVNAEHGNQTSPHVDCDIVSYTMDDLGQSIIHYQDLETGLDSEIPGNQVDLLSDISGSHVAFIQVTNDGDTIRIFDTISQTTTLVPGFGNTMPSIGGNIVAFEDRDPIDDSQPSQIATYDLSTGAVTQLTNDSLFNRNPDVSPNGDVVTWQKCQSNLLTCDIYAAIKTAPGVFTTRALTTDGNSSPYRSATNGEVAVYISDRTGEHDIYYQPVNGGTEVHLVIPGDQRDATISGDLISFESGTDHGYDTFVYDIRSGKLYQATNTAGADEKLSQISVCGDTGRIVYVKVGIDAFDAFAFTFQVPRAPGNTQDQLNDLIALVRSFNLPAGTANSLIRKLQNAIDAINASDTAATCSSLTAFINECRAQSGKKLTPEQSNQLITAANHIKTDLGCP